MGKYSSVIVTEETTIEDGVKKIKQKGEDASLVWYDTWLIWEDTLLVRWS